MCGTKKGINEQYLRIALQTKGSIHTATNDVDMKKLKEGDEFVLGKDVFRYSGGQFVWIEVIE